MLLNIYWVSEIIEKIYVLCYVQKSLVPETYAAGFIGNLEIGTRYPDETVFRRYVEFNNPTNAVASSTMTLTVTNGEKTLTSVYVT